MGLLKKMVVLAGLLALLHSGLLQAQAEPVVRPQAEKLTWQRLSYAAKKMLGTVTTAIQWQELAAEENKDLLIPVPTKDALQPTGSRLFRLEGHSVVKPLWGSEDVLKTQAWYDPGSGAVLQRTRWRQGKERWEKIYRFTDRGVYRLRRQPANSAESDQSPANWTDTLGSFYAYGAGDDSCLQVLESLVLLYLVSAPDRPRDQSPLTLCVFNKKQLHQVKIAREATRRLKVNYTARDGNKVSARKEEIEAIRFACRPRSLVASGEEAEPFSFLGLKGDFDIFFDPTTALPVQVSGHVAGLGQLDIRLQEVVLNQKK